MGTIALGEFDRAGALLQGFRQRGWRPHIQDLSSPLSPGGGNVIMPENMESTRFTHLIRPLFLRGKGRHGS